VTGLDTDDTVLWRTIGYRYLHWPAVAACQFESLTVVQFATVTEIDRV